MDWTDNSIYSCYPKPWNSEQNSGSGSGRKKKSGSGSGYSSGPVQNSPMKLSTKRFINFDILDQTKYTRKYPRLYFSTLHPCHSFFSESQPIIVICSFSKIHWFRLSPCRSSRPSRHLAVINPWALTGRPSPRTGAGNHRIDGKLRQQATARQKQKHEKNYSK